MRKLWIVVRREFLERVRSRWFIVSTILVPLLMGLVIVVPIMLAVRTTPSNDLARITILDLTGSGLGKSVAAALDSGITADTALTPVIALSPPELAAAESTATRAVLAKRQRGYLVLGPTMWPTPQARYAGANASSPVDMNRLQRVVRDQLVATRLRAAGMDPAQVNALTALDVKMQTERLTARGRGGSGEVSTIVAFFLAFVLYITIFIYGQIVLRGVMEEKQTRVAETVVSSVRPDTLLLGKILGVGGVAGLQLLISGVASVALIGQRGPLLARLHVAVPPFEMPHVPASTAVLLVVYFLLGYVVYAALFAAIGSMVSSEQDAQQVQMPIALLLVLTATLIQPVMLAPEGRMANVLSILPFSSPIIMPLRLSLVPVAAWRVAVSVAVLILSAWFAVWIAARVYRTGLLMYGKRPSLRELLRWVRASG